MFFELRLHARFCMCSCSSISHSLLPSSPFLCALGGRFTQPGPLTWRSVVQAQTVHRWFPDLLSCCRWVSHRSSTELSDCCLWVLDHRQTGLTDSLEMHHRLLLLMEEMENDFHFCPQLDVRLNWSLRCPKQCTGKCLRKQCTGYAWEVPEKAMHREEAVRRPFIAYSL